MQQNIWLNEDLLDMIIINYNISNNYIIEWDKTITINENKTITNVFIY